MNIMKNQSIGLDHYLISIVDTITGNDPIKRRWFPDYLKLRVADRQTNETLALFCYRMERDQKIDSIFNI